MNHPNRANKNCPRIKIEFARTPFTQKMKRNNQKCTHTTNPRTHINTFCRQMSTNRELDAKKEKNQSSDSRPEHKILAAPTPRTQSHLIKQQPNPSSIKIRKSPNS
ncbi:hypothetical protein BT93_H3791 [Corymbia citriodora subsp. variegata]|nr:hypothetical protein BT93_H3791 [Corymbia citriodora subsp. variegata]